MEQKLNILGFCSTQKPLLFHEDIIPLFNIIGEIIGNVIKRAQTEVALIKSKERYRRLTENAPEMIWRINIHGRLEYINPAIERTLGYHRQEVLKTSLKKYLPANSFSKLNELLQKAKDGQIYERYLRFEHELLHKDGHLVPCEVTITLDEDVVGKVIALEGIIRDLTEQKRAEKEKINLQIQLSQSQKMEALGSLASSIAHEINNPIGIILGFTEYMLDSASLEKSFQENLGMIYKEALRIKEITERMMNFVHSGELSMNQINVNQPLKESVNLMTHKFAQRKIKIYLELTQKLPPIKGNNNALKQVFLNLLINALQAIPENRSGLVEIISRQSRQDEIEVLISDNGIGIPQDKISKIFEPFFTLKDKGTGLGLSITSSIIQEHKGTIRVESHVDTGSIFIIQFPVATNE
jgi:PAS domain S-box-containing protein